jgi:tRNA threonylcarbamoyl adenosine modification protein YjeE
MSDPGTSRPHLSEHHLNGEAEQAAFGAKLAPLVRGGDILLLDGAVGAGKSTLARALIRSLTRPDMEVPSPTFTLVQSYGLPDGVELLHYDLYRLDGPEELEELGWEAAGAPDTVVLVEWPDRLPGFPKGNVLHLQMASTDDGAARCLVLHGYGDWGNRLSAL